MERQNMVTTQARMKARNTIMDSNGPVVLDTAQNAAVQNRPYVAKTKRLTLVDGLSFMIEAGM